MDRLPSCVTILSLLVLSALLIVGPVCASNRDVRGNSITSRSLSSLDRAVRSGDHGSVEVDDLSCVVSSSYLASEGLRRSLLKKVDHVSYDVTLTPDRTWTNASFASWLCGNLTGASSVEVSPSTTLPAPLLLPPCFFEFSSNFSSLSLSQVLLIGNSTTYNDPLVRLGHTLGSSLRSFSLSKASLVDASGSSYAANNWPAVFDALSSVTSLTIESSGLQGTLSGSIPTNITVLSLKDNALSGSIPSALFARMNPLSTAFSVDLSANRLQGAIPNGLFAAVPLDSLDSFSLSLSNNLLSGTISSSLWHTSLSEATAFSLDLSHNSLNGDFSFFQRLSFSALSSFSIDLSSNAFTGSLPSNLITVATDDRYSLMPLYGTIDLSGNQISGTIPDALFWAVDLSPFISLLVDLSNNKLEGSLPTALFNYTTAPLLTFFQAKFSGNSGLGGSIPSTFLSSFNPAPSTSTSTVASGSSMSAFIYLDGTGITGTLSIPDFSERVALAPLQLTFYAYGSRLQALDIHHNASLALHYLDVSSSTQLTGTLPNSLFASSSILSSLYASNTALSGSMPNLGTLGALKLKNLDLSATNIDFCAGTRVAWNPVSINTCLLTSTSAYSCPLVYPRSCSITAPPALGVPLTSGPPPCSNVTRPSPSFICIDGHWSLKDLFNETTLVLPSDAGEVFVGNMTSTEVTFQGLGTTLIITGCAPNLEAASLTVSRREQERIGRPLTQTLIATGPESRCTNTSGVALRIELADAGCKRTTTSQPAEMGRISVVISVQSSRCRTWWIILVSVLSSVAVILLVIFAATVLCFKRGPRSDQSYAKHKTPDRSSADI